MATNPRKKFTPPGLRVSPARQAAPVTIRYVCPLCGGPHPRKDCSRDRRAT
jgi:hypothetical protein